MSQRYHLLIPQERMVLFQRTPTNEAEHHTAQGATKIIDHNHPTYLHASDVGEISLVSLQLTVSMRIALLARNKLGFVNGT